VWDSAAFSSIFLASSFSCSQAESTPAHTQVTQTVGQALANQNMKIQAILSFIMIVVISSCVPMNAAVQTEIVTSSEATLTSTPPFTKSENTLSPINLEGTIWDGIDSDGDYYVYEFLSDGVLKYTSPNGTFTNGTWIQDGNSVYFETNKKISEYEGVINGDTIAGNAWNQDGHKWTWIAERQ
jgi:hypothetical protein